MRRSVSSRSPLSRLRRQTSVVIHGLLLTVLPGRIAAHDFWIEPSAYLLDSAAPLAVRLLVGDRHRGEPVPRRESRIERFSLVGANGETRVRGVEGADPAGIVPELAEGPSWLVYQSRATPHRLAGAKFDRYLAEEGLEAVRTLRAARGESELPGRERFARCAKALVRRVGSGAASSPDAVVRQPVGLPLELVPDLDPAILEPGAELSLRLLFLGLPLAGARVEAISADDPSLAPAARTDSAGRVSLRLPRGGRWLARTVHMERAADDPETEWESWWASLAFEIPDTGGESPERRGAGAGARVNFENR